MARKKILFLSDAVSTSSGLARIARDLAIRVHQHLGDVYEVASVGYGGTGSRSIPFTEYKVHSVDNWLVPELPAVWDDFVGDDEGILMCVWDMSRLYWLGTPATCPNPGLRQWVEKAKMKKWAYHAIDAEGPYGKAPQKIAQTMKGFDRVIDYSAFSSKITGNPTHLPHGIDTTVFYPRPHKEARELFAQRGFAGLKKDSLLVGIVATNQARKNWQLGIETARILLDRGHDLRLWIHTDVIDRYWSLGNLIVDYGLVGRAAITITRFTDEAAGVDVLRLRCDAWDRPRGLRIPHCRVAGLRGAVYRRQLWRPSRVCSQRHADRPHRLFLRGGILLKAPSPRR